MTQVIQSPAEFLELRKAWDRQNPSIGFVPTMGALHSGHASLFQRARQESEIVVASIFVNPTQFNDPKDLEKYPRTFQEDLELLNNLKVDVLFAPRFEEMYPDHYRFKVSENEFSKKLCGAHRPGHFEGVLTVVMKLLNLVRPTRSYFGEKDFQQLTLIREMAASFFMPVEIVGCPTVRESDGLALSSRNRLLTEEHRKLAPLFRQKLALPIPSEKVRSSLEEAGFQVDYVEDFGPRRFGAVVLGNVRLIDNVAK